MLSQSKHNCFSLPSLITICLALILITFFLGNKNICSAEDWNDKNFIESLPDESFAVVDKTPEGVVIRLLPHHDAQGNLVVPRLMECINQIFTLPPNYREKAREHLLQEYYEFVFPKLMGQSSPNF